MMSKYPAEMVMHVAEGLWQADSIRALGRGRLVTFGEISDAELKKWVSLAIGALDATPILAMVKALRCYADPLCPPELVRGRKAREALAAWGTE